MNVLKQTIVNEAWEFRWDRKVYQIQTRLTPNAIRGGASTLCILLKYRKASQYTDWLAKFSMKAAVTYFYT